MMHLIPFGKALLETGDLDPIYVMLHHSRFKPPQLQRFCVAYWCYYHAGVSACASEKQGDAFWSYLRNGAALFPRGTERRHFRGIKAHDALYQLQTLYPSPEQFIKYLQGDKFNGFGELGSIGRASRTLRAEVKYETTFTAVSERVQRHLQFGPWIAFKVADMMERVLGISVDFRDCALLDLYEEPRTGATLAMQELHEATPEAALKALLMRFRTKYAPPSSNRRLNIQEMETILCKWKSHLNGHYPMGKDTQEVAHALRGWGESADHLHRIMCEQYAIRSLV